MTNLFDSLHSTEGGCDVNDETITFLYMTEITFLFSIVWSIGAIVSLEARNLVDSCLRDSEARFPPLYSVYDYVVDNLKKEWILWEDKVPKAWKPSPTLHYSRFIVPTVDLVRNSFVSNSLIKFRKPILIVGNQGCGILFN